MKKFGLGSRLLSLLLALAMVVSMVPSVMASAAEIGDITPGNTGLTAGVNANDTISWPIKIYDYLNDGMLFEYSSAQDIYVPGEVNGGGYYGGRPVPMILEDNIIGVDYTIPDYYTFDGCVLSRSVDGNNTAVSYGRSVGYGTRYFGSSAYKINPDGDGADEITRSVVNAVDDQNPMYMNVKYTGTGTTRSYGWVANFAQDDEQYYTGDQVRYMVLVYRTNEQYSSATSGKGRNFRAFWAVSDSSYDLDYSAHGGNIDISDLTDHFGISKSGNKTGCLAGMNQVLAPSTNEWTFEVIDMKSNYVQNGADVSYGIANNWTNTWTNANGTTGSYDLSKDARVAGIGMCYPVGANGEEIDISHMAFFGDIGEAERFGANAVRFDNDPGHYIGRSVTLSHSITSVAASGTEPTVSGNGWTFTNTTASNSGWASDNFALWSSSYGINTSKTAATSTNAMYMTAKDTDSSTSMDNVPIWIYNSGNWKSTLRYVTIVYRLNGVSSSNAYFNAYFYSSYYGRVIGKLSSNETDKREQLSTDNSQWRYATFDTATIGDWDTDYSNHSAASYFDQVFLQLPNMSGSSQSIDIAYIDFDSTSANAETFGAAGAAYMNSFGNTAGKYVSTSVTFGTAKAGWNMGSNQAFTMLYASVGGGWSEYDSTYGSTAGGTNKWTNGYYSFPLGEKFTAPNQSVNLPRRYAAANGYTYVPDSVFLLDMYPANMIYYPAYNYDVDGNYVYVSTKAEATSICKAKCDFNLIGVKYDIVEGTDADGDTYVKAANHKFDMSQLPLGYTLYNTLSQGVMTAGLLESGLGYEKGIDGSYYTIMQYKDETIGYIAELLKATLVIPERDYYGPNYNFVVGEKNGVQYGYDANGQAYDLASALRARLGIVFTETNWTGKTQATAQATPTAALGSEADTLSRLYDTQGRNKLIGPYLEVKDNIVTFYDAAYYLLHNLVVADSYNQTQDEYKYLVLSRGEVTSDSGKPAYVFDAGFTDANNGNSGVVYDPIRPVLDEDGNIVVDEGGQTVTTGTGTIKLSSAVAKDMIYYTGSYTTTRFPFLPVTHAEGPFAIGTDRESYLEYGTGSGHYFQEDGTSNVTDYGASYSTRNYNYVMTSHGEFIYHAVDQLFFDFEGDDDVYLFVNGELVLDIGAAHSITTVGMNMNDFVDAAKVTLSSLTGYYDGISEKEFEDLLATVTDATKKAEYTRAHKLNLLDGQSYTFDFFYMERHGWGANCRIATNIVVTDPELKTQKTAYQNGNQIPFAGVIDPDERIEYSFAMTNEGNSKLYNLTYKDENIGVTLDPKSGLITHSPPVQQAITLDSAQTLTITYPVGKTVYANLDGNTKFTDDGNGTLTATDIPAGTHTVYFYQVGGKQSVDVTLKYGSESVAVEVAGVLVTDANGETLDVEDLTFYVDGFYDEEMTLPTPTITVTFRDDDTATAEQKLMNFLYTLAAPGTALSTGNSSNNYTGDGLWRHATVTVRGIWYKLTDAQEEHGVFNNTVYTTATPAPYSSATVRGEASHRVYVGDEPQYYQWAGHELFVTDQKMLTDAGNASTSESSQLHEYKAFFDSLRKSDGVTYDVTQIKTELCDLRGISKSYPYVTKGADNSSNAGYTVNYPNAGTYSFYVLMYKTSADRSDLEDGEYAIVLITINVTSVKDSTFVLDYGLKTSHLDANGELFKNDMLFGGAGFNVAKLMGISTTQPSYLNYSAVTGTDYNRINFTSQTGGVFNVSDGIYSMTLDIGSTGKTITYNSYTGKYSLTDPGTVTVTAKVPEDWTECYLYFWYDDKSDNGWPGTAMTKKSDGEFTLDIPGDVTNVIINDNASTNGETTIQTVDLVMTPGMETVIKLGETNEDGKYLATVHNDIEQVTVRAQVPDGWGDVRLYYWHSDGSGDSDWPGLTMTDADGDGWYEATMPGSVDRIIINNNDGNNNESKKQTWDVTVTAGKDIWTTVLSSQGDDGKYKTSTHYSLEKFTVNAKVPTDWPYAYLYYWYSDGTVTDLGWPGTQMTDSNGDGWYDLQIPVGITHVIVCNGPDPKAADFKQTVNLDVVEGAAAWITVNNETVVHDNMDKYTAFVAEPGFTFTPTNFMDELYSLYLALGVHDVNVDPTALGSAIDINDEVQMYKKVTVLPANVVYYEDDFPAIKYVGGTTTNANVFEDLGTGSDELTQDVDQDSEYGSDPTYGVNDEMSGNTLKKITIRNSGNIAYFTFQGTGFELISRTNADRYATIKLSLYKSTDVNQSTGVVNSGATRLQYIPLVNEFDQDGDGGAEVIYQVPTIRINDLDYGTYTVIIAGTPSRDWGNQYNGEGNVNWDPSNPSQLPEIVDTYLYIDGLRIYQPLQTDKVDGAHPSYNVVESGATFAELRKLVVEGYAALVTYDGVNMSIGSGTNTWAENRNPADLESLKKVITIAESLVEGNYTADSWSAVQTALTTANTVINDNRSTQNEVDKATWALRGAMDALVLSGALDTEALELLILEGEAYQYHNCTKAGYEKLTDALNAARAALVAEDATQTSIDDARATLKPVVNGVVLSQNYSENVWLMHSILEARGLKASTFTSASYANVTAARKAAEQELLKVTQSKAQLIACRTALEDAMAALVYKDGTAVSELELAILRAEGLDMANYNTSATYNTELQTALTNAKATRDNANATDTARADAASSLNTLLEPKKLRCNDMVNSKLQTILVAKDLVASNYTSASYKPVATALKAALNVYVYRHSDSEALETAVSNLRTAMNALELKQTFTDMKRIQLEAQSLSSADFQADSFQTMSDALTAANTAMAMSAASYPSRANDTTTAAYRKYNAAITSIAALKSAIGGLKANKEITLNYSSVSSAEDYLTDGPNNEVYMNGDLGASSIVFYVKEDEAKSVHNLQIAVHAVDTGLFEGAGSTGMYAVAHYGVKVNGEFAWRALATITGATEQYYTIDYTQCPKDDNGYYQVAVQLSQGMASFTNLKYNGLIINSVIGETTSLRYYNGVLHSKDETSESWVETMSDEVFMIGALSSQMMVVPGSSVTEEAPVEPTTDATINATGATLSLEEETFVNIYFEGEGLDDVHISDMGLLTWSSEPADMCFAAAENVYAGASVDSTGRFVVRTGGIPAKALGDDIYMCVYAKLADGSYVYSSLLTYSPKIYAMNRLENSTDEQTKAICVALLNYGAAAQEYFGYNTEALANSDLTAEQKALVELYSSDMVTAVTKPDAAKVGAFAQTEGFAGKNATVSLEGTFAINYYFTPSNAVEGDMTFYYWSAEAYANAEVLTAENASGSFVMTAGDVYTAQLAGIAAKAFDEAVYVAAVYESEGVSYCTGVLPYSLSTYFAGMAENGESSLKAMAEASAVYGYYAKSYFAQ